MLKAEIIRFEAEDIITTSGGTAAAPGNVVLDSCTNPNGHNLSVEVVDGVMKFVCSDCGAEGSSSGTIIGGPSN